MGKTRRYRPGVWLLTKEKPADKGGISAGLRRRVKKDVILLSPFDAATIIYHS
jgi:hypothetical protein